MSALSVFGPFFFTLLPGTPGQVFSIYLGPSTFKIYSYQIALVIDLEIVRFIEFFPTTIPTVKL